MALGLGKQYWVHQIKCLVSGTIEECIKFMQENKPVDNTQWFELWPRPTLKKGKKGTCETYTCALVEQA